MGIRINRSGTIIEIDRKGILTGRVKRKEER